MKRQDGYRHKLVAEIDRELDALAQAQRRWIPDWITHRICSAHEDGLADHGDRAFWRYAGYATVRKLVARTIAERAGDKTKADKPRQIELPGFNRQHLQDYYIVERGGEEVGVPVTDLTDAEIEAKARFLRSMSETCADHAQEILRFKQWRKHARAGLPAQADGARA